MRHFIAVLVGFACVTGTCCAEDLSIREELDLLKARVQVLENRLAEQDKCIDEQKQCIADQGQKISVYESKLAQFDNDLHRQSGSPISIAEGLEIGVGSTMVVQGTANTNNATAGVLKNEDRADASYSADITIGKEFESIGGRAFLHLEAGDGSAVEDDLTLYSNVNWDAGDSDSGVDVTELWYEQALLGDKAVLTFGKVDLTAYFDNNEAANDETTQFLGHMFGNSPVIEFPGNALGFRLAYMPLGWLEFGYGVLDGNSDWEKIADQTFHIGQVAFKTEVSGLPGNYRFLGWRNNAYHTEWSDTTQEKEASYGFGLSFDQKISDAVTLFTRYGWQDPEVYNPDVMAVGDLNYSLTHAWSAGFQVEGQPWGRQKDVLGFAVGQVVPSDDYRESDPSLRAKTEGHIEAYYRIHVNDHLSISPDVQYIWNPFGKDVADGADGIFVGGMRAQVDF